jgi:hypothetical protein
MEKTNKIISIRIIDLKGMIMALKDKKIIYEQATPSEIQILEESVMGNGQYKMVFKARLQEADVINNNRRVYPAETLEQVYIQLKDKAAARKLVGEMDHPQPQGDQSAKIKRSSTISLERACFLIRELQWDGQAIYGICETLSNRMGMDAYCLLKDNVTVGFSLRAFGETRQRSDGIIEVAPKGLKALTYDMVANPSHDSSVIMEFLTEGEDPRILAADLEQQIIEESRILDEVKQSTNLLEESSLAQQLGENSPKPICLGNICSIAPLEEAVEYIVEQIVNDKSIPKVRVKGL